MSDLRRRRCVMPAAARRAVGLVFLDVLHTHFPDTHWTLEASKGNATSTSGEVRRCLAPEEHDSAVSDVLAAPEEDDGVQSGGEQASALGVAEIGPEGP